MRLNRIKDEDICSVCGRMEIQRNFEQNGLLPTEKIAHFFIKE